MKTQFSRTIRYFGGTMIAVCMFVMTSCSKDNSDPPVPTDPGTKVQIQQLADKYGVKIEMSDAPQSKAATDNQITMDSLERILKSSAAFQERLAKEPIKLEIELKTIETKSPIEGQMITAYGTEPITIEGIGGLTLGLGVTYQIEKLQPLNLRFINAMSSISGAPGAEITYSPSSTGDVHNEVVYFGSGGTFFYRVFEVVIDYVLIRFTQISGGIHCSGTVNYKTKPREVDNVYVVISSPDIIVNEEYIGTP